MKKVLIIIVAIFALTACHVNKTYEEISYKQLTNMIDKKTSFILFIGSDTCSACSNYKETLNEVIKKYNVPVKYIDLHKLSESEESYVTSQFPITGTPTTVFVTKGKEKDTFNRINGSVKSSKIIKKFKENGYIKEW